jgi:adenosylmethionine-8-amino-7-oxononanoate aminotransferase
METLKVMSPDAAAAAPGVDAAAQARIAFEDLKRTLDREADQIAAILIEPLVQCAGGMRMYDPLYLRLVREACDHYDIHLIADEIAVGFGRTGTLFALEQGGITPDFLCLSKGLTGGYLPLAAVLTTEAIYQTFYDDPGTDRAFLHSHSYTGNPLACAVALESLSLLERDKFLEKNRSTSACLWAAAAPLADHPRVCNLRQRGMILALDLVRDKASKVPFAPEERAGFRVYQHALKKGVLLRPLGNVLYFMPPYVIAPEEITLLMAVAQSSIEEVLHE